MMRAVVTAGVFLLADCASASSPTSGEENISVTGTWVGELNYFGYRNPVELSLTQRGADIFGRFSIIAERPGETSYKDLRIEGP